jgi:ABC-type Fe3+ transport system substrate-binding protein
VQTVTATSFAALAASIAGLATISSLSSTVSQTLGVNTVVAGTSTATQGTFIFADPAQYTLPLTSLVINARAAGTLYLKQFAKSGTTYTEVGTDVLVSVVAGANTIATPGLTIQAGNYIGLYHSGILGINTPASFIGAGLVMAAPAT